MIGLAEVLALIFFLFGAVSNRKGWWVPAAALAFVVLCNTP